MRKRRVRAQSIGEYAIMITIVVSFMVAMFPMFRRGAQGLIKAGADQIGDQRNAEQEFTMESGYLAGANTVMNAAARTERREWPGGIQTVTLETTDTLSNTYTNLGFTRE